MCFFFFSSRRRHTRYIGDWSSDVCSSDLELRAADFVARLIRSGVLKSDGYRLERLHRIGGAGRLERYDAATKFDVSWPFLRELRDLGRADAKAWLEQNFDAIGVEGTLDIDRALRREPAKEPVKGAPAAG